MAAQAGAGYVGPMDALGRYSHLSRTEHREYGRALMLRYDGRADRFIRVEYAPDTGRNREVGPLDARDLVG